MPFVPLGSRKRYEVILDDDKERIANEQKSRDNRALADHVGVAASSSGYRFGNHPATFGVVRGPAVPFKAANTPWRPPSADGNGPAAQRTRVHADRGANWATSHGMRTVKSEPNVHCTLDMIKNLERANLSVMQMTDPVSVEIKRWQHFGEVTQSSEMKHMPKLPQKERNPESAPKPIVRTSGLVNFPKYMLIHNCHLKQTDQMRYVREEAAKRAAAEEAARNGEDADDSVEGEDATSPVRIGEASWCAPKLRARGEHYAGSTMAAGRGMRTSNPFRLG